MTDADAHLSIRPAGGSGANVSLPNAATLETALRRAAIINAALIKLAAFDFAELESATFRGRVDDAITAIEAADTVAGVRSAERRLADDTHQHLRAQEDLLHAREQEFTRTVSILTEALVEFKDSNVEFTGAVLQQSDRIGQLTTVRDLRTLRSRLTRELTSLRALALAKQEADTRRLARLSAKVNTLESRLAMVMARAGRDPLTGLANRAAWDQRLAELAIQLQSGNSNFAVAMIDLDQFKRINDTLGHGAGDSALSSFGELCQQAFGADDLVVRYGGDEFAVLVGTPSLDHATEHVHRMIESVGRVNERPTAGWVPFTVSVGLALATEEDTVQTLVERADKALYAAKALGRNQLVVAPSPTRTAPPTAIPVNSDSTVTEPRARAS